LKEGTVDHAIQRMVDKLQQIGVQLRGA
jgi:hypothetical protein